MSEKRKRKCEKANSNPSCPYLTQINQINDHITSTSAAVAAVASATNTAMMRINQQGDDLEKIKKALIGDDMQSGIVKKLADLEGSIKTAASWANFGKPIILGIIMAVIAGIISHYF